MTYWIDLFTGKTWQEFRKAGAKISGFRSSMRGIGPTSDRSRIWSDDEFPVRFEVRPLVLLDPEHGVPMQELQAKVEFFAVQEHAGKFKAFVRRSPNRFRKGEDGELIMRLLQQAERQPVLRPVDARKLARTPLYRVPKRKGKDKKQAVVSVPEAEGRPTTAAEPVETEAQAGTSHTEIQYQLLRLGAEMGLGVWVARNDRSRVYDGVALGEMPGMVDQLPTQFNEATQRTVELIDVLWLRGNSIQAAFEVESTTSIYSGLLRMSDLLALQPNLDIDLYLVAPDERRSKVEQEILRPTFNLRERPVAEVCGFLPFSKLTEQVCGIRKLGLASALKPDFLKNVAEYFTSTQEA
ncbi:MAG TPA: hypothetical protein VG860_05785 [Terriglobia bacterium]|nr:hypothetical protein [Terriglobia bacterium]